MSYFTAVLARDGPRVDGPRPRRRREADLERARRPTCATVADADEPVLLLVEREDAWWAVVRVDGDEDPRVFVSDVAGRGGSLRTPSCWTLGTADDEEVARRAPAAATSTCSPTSAPRPRTLQEMCDDELLPMDALAARRRGRPASPRCSTRCADA